MLTEGGHDALSALELSPRATDEELLALATDKQPDNHHRIWGHR